MWPAATSLTSTSIEVSAQARFLDEMRDWLAPKKFARPRGAVDLNVAPLERGVWATGRY
jgi:hypothetical protein